ncbi:MAG: YdcF family protein [Pirellulales bacterium]|nr:YdcF family protein [Pirellulales bacterium]
MYYFFVDLLSPFTLLFLILLAAVALLWRRRVESRRRLLLVTVPLALLWIISTPVVAFLTAQILEWPYPPISEIPEDAQAYVVLGGAILEPSETLPAAELLVDSRLRCIHAAELYKKRQLPVLVAGGVVHADKELPPLAQAMRDLLIDLGVPGDEILMEDKSRSTYENAAFSKSVLAENGIERVVLVTDADHMLRASQCFAAQDIDVTPAACRHASDSFEWSAESFLPRAGAAAHFRASMHEWLGFVWYKLTGKA